MDLPGKPLKPVPVLKAIFARCSADSRVAFGSRRPLKDGSIAPHYLTNVAVSDLENMLPGILEYEVEQTQYVMLNTLKPCVAVPPLQRGAKPRYYLAANNMVRELNAFYVDLDVGREGEPADGAGMPAGVVLGLVLERVRNGNLPLPSLGALSGRGSYLVWLLRGEGLPGAQLPLATPGNLDTWRAIEDEFHRRTVDLFSDRAARTVARWLKRPGTVDTLKLEDGTETKTGRTVVYMTFGSDLSTMPVYTMHSLKQFLGLHVAPPPPVPQLPPPSPPLQLDPQAPPRHPYKGGRKRNVGRGKGGEPYGMRVREMEALNQHRGGLPANTCRRAMLFHYHRACFAWHMVNYPDRRDLATVYATEEARKLNRTFRPPLTHSELYYAIKFKRTDAKRARTRKTVLAAALKVTAAEVEALGLVAIVPADIEHTRRADAARAKADRCAARRTVRDKVDALLRAGLSTSEVARQTGQTKQMVNKRRRRLEALGQVAQLPLPGTGSDQGAQG